MALPKPLTSQEKARFFDQLAALLNAGMSVQHSVTLAGQDCHASFQQHLQSVSVAVSAGQDFASTLALGRYFDRWTISLLRLAEYSGCLPQTCRQLALMFEAKIKRERLYRSARWSAIAIIWSLLIVIAVIFNRSPSGFIKPEFWLRSLAIGLLLVGISSAVSRYPRWGAQVWLRHLPVVGQLIQAHTLLDLAQLRLPLSCGISILTAVELLQEHMSDPVMRANLASAKRHLRIGQPLSHALQGKVPPLVIQILRTGEETGNLDTALEHLAEHYEREIEWRLNLLQASLRPLSLIALGSLVAAVGVRGISLLLNSLPD